MAEASWIDHSQYRPTELFLTRNATTLQRCMHADTQKSIHFIDKNRLLDLISALMQLINREFKPGKQTLAGDCVELKEDIHA